jgi:6-phosphofructokinase 1
MIKGNMLIGQSGGPTSVINASVVGAITEGMNNPNIEKIYGAINGVAGVLSEDFYDFSNETKEDLEILKEKLTAINFFNEMV